MSPAGCSRGIAPKRPRGSVSLGLVLDEVGTVFGFGCGRGEDLELLTAEGIVCSGWDPAYRPDAPQVEADVVNLGYVINVIEKPEERAATLRRAWNLCRQLMTVSAQVLVAGRGKEPVMMPWKRSTSGDSRKTSGSLPM